MCLLRGIDTAPWGGKYLELFLVNSIRFSEITDIHLFLMVCTYYFFRQRTLG